MKQFAKARMALIAVTLLSSPSVGHAQQKAQSYQPLSNQEMAQMGIWDQWVKTYNELTAKQKAEVMRRHINMCLDSFQLTDDQRTFVKDFTAKYVNDGMYDADPEKRAAIQREMQPIQQQATSVLGPDLTQKFFAAKPPIAVLEAVKSDPAFK